MKIWLCDKCGCELKQDNKPEECPLCKRNDTKFIEFKRKNPDKEELKSLEKYEEVIETLEEYTEDCEPEQTKYSLED